VDAESVLITHLSEVMRRHAHEILSRQDVRRLVDNVKKENPAIVEELIPEVLSLGQIQQVLKNLLAEGIPVNNLWYIMEHCGNFGRQIKDPNVLTELVRKSLSRAICESFSDSDGNLNALSLDPELEEEIRGSLATVEGETRVNLPPQRLRQITAAISEQVSEHCAGGTATVILTDSRVRPHIRAIVSRISSEIPVLAYDEVCQEVKLNNAGIISLQTADAMEREEILSPEKQESVV